MFFFFCDTLISGLWQQEIVTMVPNSSWLSGQGVVMATNYGNLWIHNVISEGLSGMLAGHVSSARMLYDRFYSTGEINCYHCMVGIVW